MEDKTQRPNWRDESILSAAAKKVLEAMPAGTVGDGQDDGAIADIVRALRSEAPAFDEYCLARYLEQHCSWDCDRDVMMAFETAGAEVTQAVREATVEWVRRNGIKPRLAVDANVKVMVRSPAALAKQEYDGVIVRVDPEQAAYTIMIPALGHVREGSGCHGVILSFEELHPLAVPVEEFQLEPSC